MSIEEQMAWWAFQNCVYVDGATQDGTQNKETLLAFSASQSKMHLVCGAAAVSNCSFPPKKLELNRAANRKNSRMNTVNPRPQKENEETYKANKQLE